MKKGERDYFLGLDIGTDSVGYAVTDLNYNILKFHGKSMWGSRLFDAAETAEARRLVRTNRRRTQRRKWRLQLLQELFAEEITKVDAGFYQRMKESMLYSEDKTEDQLHTLFNDKDYTDVDYHMDFPTIYHLRKALIEGEKEYDVRLVYLAVHHILKHRGHFLFAGAVDKVTSFHTTYELFVNTLNDELDLDLKCDSVDDFAEILKNKQMTVRDKTNQVVKLFNCDKSDKQTKSIIGLICGATSKLTDVFQDESLENVEQPKVCFSKGAYDEIRDQLETVLAERCEVVDVIKSVYDWGILADILKGGEYKGSSYLSMAKVKEYEKHSEDLRILKKVIKKYKIENYKDFFQKVGKDNYSAYIGYTIVKGKRVSVNRCKKEDFYKTIKSILDQINVKDVDQSIEYILKEMEQGTFMPLLVSKDNGVIPYQVHGMELRCILNNAKKYLPFLQQKDDSGITIEEKIIQLFEFRIPYYVGPLNTSVGENSWMVRKQEGAIRPWNFEEKVDLDQSAERFIRRMTNKCTYLIGKDVLPKNSLIYSEYMVLNEVNNIKIKGEKISVGVKQDIVEKLFKKSKKVTGKKLLEYLISEGYEVKQEDLSGFDQNFNSSLSSYIAFKKVFGEDVDKYSIQQMVEDIILWITLYGEDRKMLKRVIRNHYLEEQLSDEQLNAVCKIKLQGWGRFSREFLQEVQGADCETGEVFHIMQALRNTQDNLMQLLSQRYTFIEEIQKVNQKQINKIDKISYETVVEDLVASPAIKRAVWQVVQITEEIRKIMGKEPTKIFVEMARGAESNPKRKDSRKQNLLDLYSKIKDEAKDWEKELENRPDSSYRSIKLYLYYTQMGRCMYSGEPIDLARLADATVYDRDHIYPQSKTKDDSIDNLVLVKSGLNREKNADIVSPEIQKKMSPMWRMLLDRKLISKEKFNRLMRKTPLTKEELAGFINRQLVETRQSSKLVAEVMNQLYETTEVVYVKAGRVSEFRKDPLGMIKVRSLNDLHHAKDAYLNIVVGNVYHEKFTKNPLRWLKSHPNVDYSLNQMYNFDLIKKDQVIWKRGKEGTIATIRKYMRKNDVQYTRYATCNKHGQNGGLFNQQPVGKSENASIPIKKGMDVKKYGGYKTVTSSYFALVESEDKKGNSQRSIEAVPLYLAQQIEKDKNVYLEYCKESLKMKNPKIILPKIKKDSKLAINGFPMHLRGTTGIQLSLQGAVQLIMTDEMERYMKKIEKYNQRNSERNGKKQLLPITEADSISKEENAIVYDVFYNKQINTIYKYRPSNQAVKMEKGKEIFLKLSLEEQCVVLNEILHLFQCKPITGDLSKIGGSAKAGNIAVGKIISNTKSAVLVNQSVTGLFQQEIDLLNIRL